MVESYDRFFMTFGGIPVSTKNFKWDINYTVNYNKNKILELDVTSTGWKMFMNTFFTFVFLGLVVSVNIELGLQAVTGGEGGYDKIMELVNANEVKPLVDIMSIGLMGLLFLILCCIFGFKLCGEAVSLASQMSGGQIKSSWTSC